MKTLLILLLSASVAFAVELPKADQLELAGRVHVIFEAKCHGCHGGGTEKPSGDFGYVLDLQRVANNPDFVIREHPQKSELYRLIEDGDMPPSDQDKYLRLTNEEVNYVRRWIASKAPHELPAVLPKLDPKKALPDPSALSAEVYALKEQVKLKRVTLALKQQPVSEIIAELEKQTGFKIGYHRPQPEPVLSITAKNHTLLEALEYLTLCGNFSLSFNSTQPRIGPNPPPELPLGLPKVRPPNKRQKTAGR